jgi:4-hydroxy-4-methyl-2-oxoglutarate aldolase
MRFKALFFAGLVIALIPAAVWLQAQQPDTSIINGFRTTEVASVADAIEQLYGTQNYMSGDVRAIFKTKFVGPAVTVQLTKEEHKDPAGLSKMIEAIDTIPAGSVLVIASDGDLKYGVLGGLMGTTLKYRGAVGAVTNASVRDIPQLTRLQFPVYSRGVAPGTTVNHYRVTAVNVPVTVSGVTINAGDLVSADEDGVVVIPKERAAEILKKSLELDFAEHSQYPFIETTKSLSEAIKKFGRL